MNPTAANHVVDARNTFTARVINEVSRYTTDSKRYLELYLEDIHYMYKCDLGVKEAARELIEKIQYDERGLY